MTIWAVTFDPTISLGTIISAATFAGAILVAYLKATQWLDHKLNTLESTMVQHTGEIEKHGARMDRYEERYARIAEQLQWLIGRMDGDRRGGPPPR